MKRLTDDELLSPIFNKIAKVKWDEHLPIIYRFLEHAYCWRKKAFTGQPYPKHASFTHIKRAFQPMAYPF